MKSSCYCGKPKPYEQCCGRFISGQQMPKTPEQLMRSRFTAYVLGEGDYVLQTWFPATAPHVSAAQLLLDSPTWRELEVLDKSQNGDEGVVEFKAYFTEPENPGQLKAMHEVSEFIRVGGRWLYVGGRVN